MNEREAAQDVRVAWVTGASRGLGRAVALGLAAKGMALLLTSRSSRALERVAEEVRVLGGADVLACPGSVEDGHDVGQAVQGAMARWGRLDVLVNNAGISPVMGEATRLRNDDLTRIVDTNLVGTMRCSQTAVKVMGPGSSIVNISSVHASVGMAGLAAYSATKGGIEAFTRSLALECAPMGIRVNAVAPGYFETDMTGSLRADERWRKSLLDRIPMGRFGIPDEVAGLVCFLAGAQSSYLTGTTITIDGGWSAQ